jgi:hypothetical protein
VLVNAVASPVMSTAILIQAVRLRFARAVRSAVHSVGVIAGEFSTLSGSVDPHDLEEKRRGSLRTRRLAPPADYEIDDDQCGTNLPAINPRVPLSLLAALNSSLALDKHNACYGSVNLDSVRK